MYCPARAQRDITACKGSSLIPSAAHGAAPRVVVGLFRVFARRAAAGHARGERLGIMRPSVLHALCCLCGAVRSQAAPGVATGGTRSHARSALPAATVAGGWRGHKQSVASNRSLAIARRRFTAPSAARTAPAAIQHSYDTKASNWRHWRRCEFHSIGPVDQVIFTLLGGKVDQLGNKCTKWDGASCSCAAPLDLLGKTHTVVEIGANDGLHMSNSRFFDLQLGWRSLCVEANPQVYKRLTVNRPDCINVNTLVGRSSDFNGSSSVPYISFYRPPGKEKKHTDRDWETGLSGVESTYATNNEITSLRRAQSFAKRFGLEVERDRLPVVPFSQLFAKHGIDRIDLLSIDVEGAEDTVVQSIDFGAVTIGMIVIEKPSQLVTALLLRNHFSRLGIVTEGADRFFLNQRWHEKSQKGRQVPADTPAAAGRGRGEQSGPRTPTTITVGPWSWQLDATRAELGLGVIVVAIAFGAVVIACACVLI